METEEERQARRRARLEQMKKEKRRRELLYKWGIPVAAGLAIMIGVGMGIGAAAMSHRDSGQEEESGESQNLAESREKDGVMNQENPGIPGNADQTESSSQPDTQGEAMGPFPTLEPLGGVIWEESAVFRTTENTKDFTETNLSKYGVFINAQTGEILAQREAYTRMNPASMTKMLTVLVAAEHLTAEDLDKTAPITIAITDYSFVNGCSNTGHALNENVTVRDMFYGTILPSGADSALALAIYVAGSHEAFVDMMNEKLDEMGLGETTHVTNCVGIYDEAHYSTAYDMAVILKAAVDNPFCRDVMAAHTYNTSLTPEHPEGLLISNWFLRRIEDKDTHGEVLCAKTGYVDQSGSCAASLGLDRYGREYLCVTAGSVSTWTCISDQVELYQTFLPETEEAGEQGGGA